VKVVYYEALAAEWRRSINEVLWKEKAGEGGAWFDYDLLHHILREDFYPTNIAPLWSNIDDDDLNLVPINFKTDKVLKYLELSGALDYPGGLPTSLLNSGKPINQIIASVRCYKIL